MAERYITLAIHTYEKAVALRTILEREGIVVEFRNVNIDRPVVSSGVRVRIREHDLPLALRVVENRDIFDMQPHYVTSDKSRPIVVPVDFSDRSFAAAASAFFLASRQSASIVLLHTYIDPYVAGTLQLTDSMTYEIADIETRDRIRDTARTQMRHFSSRLKDMIKRGEIPAASFTTAVVEGVPEDAISEYVRVNGPHLIVMSTRHPEEKELDMIGSVTAEVLDRCRVPVISLPESENGKVSDMRYSRVLFFSSLDQQDILAVDTMHRIISTSVQGGGVLSVTIAVLPVKKRLFGRSIREATDALLDYCRQNFNGVSFSLSVISDENTLQEVKALSKDTPFDLIVVPNKKKNIFTRLFSPTLAHRILFAAHEPMLVIPV
ncbi:MAG: universal stress protein [Muribaculaceae bacterium]|nr:universal stress protein [Muribaculaceae bacterium]